MSALWGVLGSLASIVTLCASMLASPSDVEAFRRTSPHDLTIATAGEHLYAARFAGTVYGIDPALLLGIAWHESRYTADAVTREPGHRVSCGAMTPVPQARCSSDELTPVGGYMAGARHLRVWLNICHSSEWCALTAYAGGRGLVRACARGAVIVRPGVDACDVAGEFRRRAAIVRQAVP